MIKELKINNLAIIKDVKLEFLQNFSTLTGETGAGKSIILDGLALITGSRANVSVIRHTADKLQIEAVLSISEKLRDKILKIYEDIDLSDLELIIYREISKDGKSKISINGKRVTLAGLSSIMEIVIDIVGQHENQYLLNKAYHIELLDGFLDLKKYRLKDIVSKLEEVNSEILKLENYKKEILEKKDFYNFSIEEIAKANLYEGIDEELEREYKLLFNSGRINDSLSNLSKVLEEEVFPGLKKAIKSVSNLEEFENIYEFIQKMENSRELLYEVSNNIYITETNEQELEDIANRLSYIEKLKLKYADNIKDILEYKKDLEEKLSSLEYSNEKKELLENEKTLLISEYMENAESLSQERKAYAKILEQNIVKELQDLNMKDAKFKVNFSKKSGFYENGIDDVEFLIKTNKGQDFTKLSKTSSGGEISRIMLALKIVFSKVDDLACIIFDEIDAGISGETVKLVAKKLKELSKDIQVICVTHSPNIAAASNEQFFIYKADEDKETITNIKKLSDKERVKEIARIISGDDINKDLLNYVEKMIKENNV